MTCCPTKALPAEGVKYQEKGTFGCLSYYKTGSGSTPILFVPDIFGYHPHTLTTADRIAAGGDFTVYHFDYFAGSEWGSEAWPLSKPLEGEEWQHFVAYITSNAVFNKIKASAFFLSHMANDGKPVRAIGFCWGAAMLGRLAAEPSPVIRCAAMPHPSFVDVKTAENTRVPILLMPSEEDGEMLEVKSKLEERNLLGGYFYARSSVHGFAAARYGKGKEDEINRDTAIDMTIGFFKSF